VKLNGFRIELGEIESTLLGMTTVQSACALVHAKSIVAYVVPRAERHHNDLVADCRERCVEFLPEYMIPKFFVVLESMPLSANGKVQRNKLPAPEISDLGGEKNNVVIPCNPLQQRIAECFEAVLRLGHHLFDVHTDFFTMGGDSLGALHLLLALRQRTGLHIGVADFFQNSTIAALAELAEQRGCLPGEGNNEQPQSSASLFTLQESDDVAQTSSPPHFLLHGAGASALAFRPLISAIADPHRSSYGVEDTSLGGAVPFAFQSIQDVAEAYAKLVLNKLRESGHASCVLSGWSYGGVVGIEVARRLEASGIRVELLSLFDSPIRGPDSPDDGDECYAHEEAVIREAFTDVGDATSLTHQLLERAVQHWKSCITLLRAHRTAPFPLLKCKTVHFTVSTISASREPSFLNDALEHEAKVVVVDGSHWNMLSEVNVSGLAQNVKQLWHSSV